MKMNRLICCVTALSLLVLCLAACAETAQEETEQGLDEIRPLMEMAEVGETEGMSLEEMTDAFTEALMSEYIDSATGFSMQYPSAFVFEEESDTPYAATTDGKATLFMDNMVHDGALNETTIREAILYETPGAEIRKNEQNGCLRVDRLTEDGTKVQTDLYLLTEKSFHHIILKYPEEEKGTYFSYIEYMINTMSTRETDLG